MQTSVVIFLIFLVFAVYKYRKDVLLILPIINIILDLSFNFFEGSGHTVIGVSAPAAIRLAIYLIIIGTFYKQLSQSKYPALFNLFILYIFILTFFSSDIFISFKNYVQFLFALLMFPLGFLYFNSEEKLKKFIGFAKYAIIIYSLSFILGNIFGIGTQQFGYSEDIQDTVGFIPGGGTYAGAVIISLLPLILYYDDNKRNRLFTIILGSIFILGTILTARRTAIIIPLVGLLTFLGISKFKSRILLSISIMGLFLFMLRPYFMDKLIERIDVRVEKGKFEKDFFEREARYYDWLEALEQATNFNEPITALFGNNLFAEGGWRYGVKLGRMMHNDYAVFLKGSGIIGFILYLTLMLSIYLIFGTNKFRIKQLNFNLLRTSLITLLIIFFVVSINGGYQNISYRSILFLLMGAISRLLYECQVSYKNYLLKVQQPQTLDRELLVVN